MDELEKSREKDMCTEALKRVNAENVEECLGT